MSIALSEFWKRLVLAGITDAAGCKQLAKKFAASQGGPPENAEQLAKYLVRKRTLTRYQAKVLLRPEYQPLKVGDYQILQPETSPPFRRWYQALKLPSRNRGWVLRIQGDPAAPAERWLDANGDVSSPQVQAYEFQRMKEAIWVFTSLPPGQLLANVLADVQELPQADVIQFGISLSRSLQSLHDSGLTAGFLTPDRIWRSDQHEWMLLREPYIAPLDRPTGSIGWLDVLEIPAAYAAPELADKSRPPDATTDIYSLGCLLYRLVTGRAPFDGDDPRRIMASHAGQPVPELVQAIEAGQRGDPLMRVIAYAMAKSPASRFSTATQFAAALEAAKSTIQAGSPKVRSHDDRTGVKKGDSEHGNSIASEKQSQPKRKTKRKTSSTSKRDTKQPKVVPAPPSASSSSTQRLPQDSSNQSPAADSGTAVHVQASRSSDPTEELAVDVLSDAGGSATELPNLNNGNDQAFQANSTEAPVRSGQREELHQPAKIRSSENDEALAATSSSQGPSSQGPSSLVPSSLGSTPDPPPISASAPTGTIRESQGVFTTDDQAMNPSGGAGHPGEAASPSHARARRRKKKKKKQATLILGAMCVAVLGLMVVLVVRGPTLDTSEESVPRRIPATIPPVGGSLNDLAEVDQPDSTADVHNAQEVVAGVGYELVEDGRLLYAPPYAAKSTPPSLALLPPGPAVIGTFRVNRITASATGSELIDAFTPPLGNMIQSVADRAGVPLKSIERLTVTLHPGDSGWPEPTFVITLDEGIPASTLVDAWQVEASRTRDGATIFADDSVDSDAFYFADSEDEIIRQFAMGSIKQISEVASIEGEPIALARSMQQLWDSSSHEADAVVLLTPNFVVTDARRLLESMAPGLIESIKSLFIPDVSVVLWSATVAREPNYVEMRFVPSGGVSRSALQRQLAESFRNWPSWADDFVVNASPDASWRLLASRLPLMVRFVVDQARFGITNDTVVMNAYLPSSAVTQVTVATVLALNTPAGQTVVESPSEAVVKKLSIEEMLDRNMSVSFDQESLEFAIDAIVDSFRESLPAGNEMPPVRILGGDLQLMGITQNQQIRDFAKTDMPLRTVLTDLVVAANPDKSATGPADPKQALVWVVADDPEGAGKAILITTRDAAQGKYTLPREFAPQ